MQQNMTKESEWLLVPSGDFTKFRIDTRGGGRSEQLMLAISFVVADGVR